MTIYGGAYYHISSKGFLTPLYFGGAVLIEEQLLIDLLSFDVESLYDTLPGKQPAEKCSSRLRTLCWWWLMFICVRFLQKILIQP